MSSGLAISADDGCSPVVSERRLQRSSSPHGKCVGFSVSPRTIVQSSLGSRAESQLQVNLFLHQVTHNAAGATWDCPLWAATEARASRNRPWPEPALPADGLRLEKTLKLESFVGLCSADAA